MTQKDETRLWKLCVLIEHNRVDNAVCLTQDEKMFLVKHWDNYVKMMQAVKLAS